MKVPKLKYAVGSVAQAAAEGADSLLSEARKDVVAARSPERTTPVEMEDMAEAVSKVKPETETQEPVVAVENLKDTTKLVNSFDFQGGNKKMDKQFIMESLSEVADSPIVDSKETIAEFITDLHRVQLEQESKPLLSQKDFKKLTKFASMEERVEKKEGGEISDADKYISLYKAMEESMDKAETDKDKQRIMGRWQEVERGFEGSTISEALQKMDAENEDRDGKFLGGIIEKVLDGGLLGAKEAASTSDPLGQEPEASISNLEGPDPIEPSNNAPITNTGYAEGGNVEKKEKLENILQSGEDGADKAIVEIMKYIPGSEGPPKGLVDLLEPVLRKAGEMYRENKKIKKAEGGSLMAPDMPVDTYDNIPPEEMAAVEASQLPDDEMEDEYAGFVLDEALSTEDQEYLLNALEGDERLGDIFDKVMDIAGEFAGDGAVEGPGTGTSDSIPARLSDGEFVFTKKATDQLGTEQLQTMMDDAERAYDGGLMQKYMGGSILSGMQDEMTDPDKAVHDQMLAANAMPSVRKNR
jgi:SOS response regulatory protein OraA/RecX